MNKDERENMKLENQICFPLYAASRKVTRLYGKYLNKLGITYTQYIVMLVLWEADNLTVGAICDKLKLDSGTLTPVLKKLEKEGLVERKRSLEDSRVVVTKLTEKGKMLQKQAKDIPKCIFSSVGLPKEKLRVLYGILYEFLDQEN